MQQIQGTLIPTAPFDFDKSLELLGHFRPAMGEQKTRDGVLTKAVSVNGQVVVFLHSGLEAYHRDDLPGKSLLSLAA